MKIRVERVNSELQRQIARIIATDLKDPRIGTSIISVTKVSVTPDLKYAKVYLSVLADGEEARQSALNAVRNAASFIRNMLKDAVQIRLLPELNFILDTSVDYGMKIDGLLAELNIPPVDDGQKND